MRHQIFLAPYHHVLIRPDRFVVVLHSTWQTGDDTDVFMHKTSRIHDLLPSIIFTEQKLRIKKNFILEMNTEIITL
jgi:hypothetical protein